MRNRQLFYRNLIKEIHIFKVSAGAALQDRYLMSTFQVIIFKIQNLFSIKWDKREKVHKTSLST